MSNVPPPHVIIQIAECGRVACDGYYDLPVILPAYIGLITDGSAIADREASRLRRELKRQILSLPGARLETRELPCGTCPAYRADFNCTAIDRSRSRNVIVFIGDGTRPPSSNPHVVTLRQQTKVLVLLPPKSPEPPVPFATPTTNTAHWASRATEFVPEIFAAAGLTEADARIFISYRREETGDLAEQLFEELSRHHFDVFVDRFRIAVGADFHQRILQELAHKSMAVFLESKTILGREWIEYEIAVAKSSRIGVFALQVPGGQTIPGIDRSRRLDIHPSGGILTPPELSTVIDTLAREHSLSQIRRRRLLRENMQRALRLAGVFNQSLVEGTIVVEPNPQSAKRYVIWLPSRPAALPDFYFAATFASSPPPVRAVIGPAAHMVGTERLQMRWLAQTAGVRSFDEGHMLQIARAMKGEAI